MAKRHTICAWFIFISLLIFSIKGKGQKYTDPSKIKLFNITVNFDDYTVKTQMLNHDKRIRTDNERVYMWYTSQRILETYGGYDGKLLHGNYQAFYLNYQLKESGEINYGLKSGKWKYWYPDGHLKEEIYWRKGVKDGAYMLYNEEGNLMAKGRFKADKLHGIFYTYSKNGSVAEKKIYKYGVEQVSRKKQRTLKKQERLDKKSQRDAERKGANIRENKKSFLEQDNGNDVKNKLRNYLKRNTKSKKKSEHSPVEKKKVA